MIFKTRLYDLENKMYILGVQVPQLFLFEKDGEAFYHYRNTPDGRYDVPVVVESSTGKKDKNGLEIYEGDLIKWNGGMEFGGYNKLFEVKYLLSSAVYDSLLGGFYLCARGSNAPFTPICGYNEENIEIVGNIHDAPYSHT